MTTVTNSESVSPVYVCRTRLIREDLRSMGEMNVATSTRPAIDAAIKRVVAHLKHLLSADLGPDPSGDARVLFRACYRHLDVAYRPSDRSPAYYAFNWLRNAVDLANRVMDLLASLLGLAASMPPGTRPETVEVQAIKVDDYYETEPGVFRQVANMTVPRLGTKVLHFYSGTPALVSGSVPVHRPITYVSDGPSYGPPAYAPAR